MVGESLETHLYTKYTHSPDDSQLRIASLLEERRALLKLIRKIQEKKRDAASSRNIIAKSRVYANFSPVKSRAIIAAERKNEDERNSPANPGEVQSKIGKDRPGNSLFQQLSSE